MDDETEAGSDGRVRSFAPGGRTAFEAPGYPEDRRKALEAELRKRVRGEVRFDLGSRALFSTDASNYRIPPLGVVLPRDAEDVVAAMEACASHGAPVTPRGGGTGLAGAAVNAAVILDFSRYMHRVVSLDAAARRAEVEPGCILDTLRDMAQEHDLTFGPDPATHRQNSIGGMIGNNSCGVHSVMAGRTSDNVEELEVVTAEGARFATGRTSEGELAQIIARGGRRGEIYRALDDFRQRYADMLRNDYPRIPRRVSGYENLDELLPENGFNVARALVGTEATCVTVVKATLKLVDSPRERALAILGFRDVFAAADAVPRVLEYGPVGLEGIDSLLIGFIRSKHLFEEPSRLLPDGEAWLMVEFGSNDREEATEKARRLADNWKGGDVSACVLAADAEQAALWKLRESALAATAHAPDRPESWPGWEDSAVPREALGDYLRDLKALMARHGYEASIYGHFGDGLVHCRIPFELQSEKGIANWRAFLEAAADLVARHGGSLSGEHGDGQARSDLLQRMYPPQMLEAFREFKAIWDPEGRMNPGRIVDPFPATADLRVGPGWKPREIENEFAYASDGGSFARATLRCVGVGACRRVNAPDQVMCPSYLATREEKHSTRGRSRLLFEMMRGGTINDGFDSREVEEALDLCLACKGCKSDCPVNVDMATYKAEFRARHYARRLRPRAAWSMGLIHKWAPLGAAAPTLANLATRAPGISAVTKWAGGIAPARTMPRFARSTFAAQFRTRKDGNGGGRGNGRGSVLLWPDTFNNHFRTDAAWAATTVLEALGYTVEVPHGRLCCGRPLYDWGRLSQARELWRRSFAALGELAVDDTPIIGLEPACVSAFRDELPGLFPGDERAARLAEKTVLFSEFLDREEVRLPAPSAAAPLAVQTHCHQHSVLDRDAARRVLERNGFDLEMLPSGCCGMAGSFGFEAKKYEVSLAAAQARLLPAIRRLAGHEIVADGFSCREQIEQETGRPTLHLAQLLVRAVPK